MNIGVDIGGTKIRAGLVENGKVLKKDEIKHDLDISSEQLIENILILVNELTNKKENIDGIGIGIPGVLSKDRSTWIKVPNMVPQMRNTRFAEIIGKKLGVKAKMENDANAAALGELQYGIGKGYDNFIMVTLGAGIGGGIIIDRKLYVGKENAGEIGHMMIAGNGLQCPCGNRGCWEEYVSVKAVNRLSVKYLGKKMDSIELAKLAEEKNQNALNLFSEMGRYLGIGLRNMANIFDPDAIVIAGGLSNVFKFMLEEAKNVMKDSWLSTRIEVTEVKDIEILGPESLLHYF
jgi:glucokinase